MFVLKRLTDFLNHLLFSYNSHKSVEIFGIPSRLPDVCDQDVCDPDVCDPDVCDLDVCDHLFVTKTFVTRTFVTILKTDVCDQELKF